MHPSAGRTVGANSTSRFRIARTTGTIRCGPTEQFAPETDRKDLRRDLEGARNEIVAKLVEKHERAKHRNERGED